MAKRMTAAEKAERAARMTKMIAGSAFVLGVAASVAANVVAATGRGPIGIVVSAWPAVALLLTVHLFQHAPRVWWIKILVAAVAGVAGWISYWHMVEVALQGGESALSAHLLPVTVDAMMAVATVVLTHKPKPARRRPARKPVAKAASSNVRQLRDVSR